MSRSLLALAVWLFAVATHADDGVCSADDRLSRAAAELLLHGQTRPDGPQLMAAVRALDSDAVGLHALFVPFATGGSADPQPEWLASQHQRADAELVCGSAQSELGKLVVVSAKAGALDPIRPHDPIVRGSLAPGFERAELVIASGDGKLERVGVSAATLAQGIVLDRDLPLPWTIQLVAHGPAGPRPVAERRISKPSATESPWDVATEEVATSDAPHADLGQLVTDLRELRRRPKLRDNRLLRAAAQAHAAAVCQQGRVAHELTKGDDPSGRLAKAGLSARLVGEAIARAQDANAAFVALQHSPSHLLTLLEPRFTDIGVGAADDRQGKHCYVVLLCAWPRASVRP